MQVAVDYQKYSSYTAHRSLLGSDPKSVGVSSSPSTGLGSRPRAEGGWGETPSQMQSWVRFFFNLLECDYQPVPILPATLERARY